MKIILMRHGQAESYANVDSDSARKLTDFGQAQALETANYLAEHYQADMLVVSPYVRAQQTAAQVNGCFSALSPVTQDNITPEDDAREALKTLGEHESDCMIVVCHMSIVAHIAALLTGDYPESFALAEARVFETEFVMMGMATEIDRFVPKQP